MGTRYALALLLAFASTSAVASGDGGYEWAGIFDVSEYKEDASVLWLAQKVDGEYADATMNIMVMNVASDEEEALEDAEKLADVVLDADSCVSITHASKIIPSSTM